MGVNVHEAKTHLPLLLERVAMGEEVCKEKIQIRMGKMRVCCPDDFNNPLPKDIASL